MATTLRRNDALTLREAFDAALGTTSLPQPSLIRRLGLADVVGVDTTGRCLQSDWFGNIVAGAFTPVLAKHSKSFSLVDAISVGVDRMRRNFEPMRKQVEAWRQTELSDVAAKMNHLRGVH